MQQELDQHWVRLCQLVLQVARPSLGRCKLSYLSSKNFLLVGPARALGQLLQP